MGMATLLEWSTLSESDKTAFNHDGFDWARATKHQRTGACGIASATNKILDEAVQFSFQKLTGDDSGEPGWYEKYVKMGREKVATGQFPFFAAVFVKHAGVAWQCAGTLVDELYVVTSASCLVKQGWELDDVKLKVALGYVDFDENPGKMVKVESYKLHGAFKYPRSDFALIK